MRISTAHATTFTSHRISLPTSGALDHRVMENWAQSCHFDNNHKQTAKQVATQLRTDRGVPTGLPDVGVPPVLGLWVAKGWQCHVEDATAVVFLLSIRALRLEWGWVPLVLWTTL
eukprot:3927584-Amphidinium_carterae.3